MKKLVLLLVIAFSTVSMASDIAFYIGGWNPGWYDATQFDDVAVVIDKAGHNFKDIQEFDDSANGLAAFAAWIEENTDDGELDIIWLNGTMPSVLYQFPNVDPDGSPAETWLDNGNMFINVGDWFAYMSYEGGARSADNGGAGAANILDLGSGIIQGGPQGTMEITAAGAEYIPSMTAVASDRPVMLSEVAAPWEVAEIFAQNASGAHADPIVIRNTETNGYLAIVNQNAGGGWFTSRGLACAELINNWIGPIVGLSDPALAAPLNPDDEAIDVLRDIDLTWAAGETAATHDVYFGTSAEDVNGATTPVSAGQSGTTYDPGILTYGQTYFWRIDEVNGAPDRTVFKGNVWSFEVEPVGYPITSVTATASSSQSDGMGAERTIDGSGLNELDQHSTMATDMWLSGVGDPSPSIQYEFDMVYKLHELMVWNSNQLIEAFVGLGAKDVVIETSIDGAEWVVLEGATLLNQATGTADYTANTIIDFAGVMAKYVKVTVNAGWGFMPQYGISEVRFSFIPTFAREPQPTDGAIMNSVAVELGWRAGREAVSHEVYLGTDSADLPLLDTVTDNSLDLSNQGLSYATTYFWTIKEVDEAGTPTSYDGPIWSFTTPDYGTVDSFEQYDDKCNRIFFAWEDGLGHNGGEEVEDCEVPASNGNGGGSIVGNASAPFAEKAIVNLGSSQSMPFNYDNAFGDSYATLSINGQDWTTSDVQTLSLAFRGEEGNTGTLYVKINNTKISYDGPATDIGSAAWTTWNIVLADTGANPSNVTSLEIGVDGASAAGMLYIDDIRLLPKIVQAPGTGLDIAISAQANWFGQAAADREIQEIINNVPGASVKAFTAGDQDALADWVSAHTGNGVANLLILCGQLPDTIYEPGNVQADDSIIELFLDDGNTIINTGDWIFYVVNSAGTNGPGGLQTIMDIPAVTVAGGDNTAVVVTAEGQALTPSLQDLATDRPFHLDTLEGDWEVELVLAQNSDGTLADPVIVRNSVTGGRIGVFYQTAGQDDDPRGEVLSEWINNWYLDVVSGGN